MAYDERLAKRLRALFAERREVVEKKMFGGIAFMVRGHMCVGIIGDSLMARVGPDQYANALRRRHARELDFTGRPMKGFVVVEPAGIASVRDLRRWVASCEEFVTSLPSKGAR